MAKQKTSPRSIQNGGHTRAVAPKPVNKKKKILTIVLVVALVVVVIAGIIAAVAAANWEEYRKLAADRKTVATCNGYEIPYEELRFVTLLYKDELAAKYGDDIWDDPATAEQYRDELESRVMENLNQNYKILAACDHLKIKTEGTEIDNYVDEQMKTLTEVFESEAEYEAWLEEEHMTEHYARFSLGVNFLESAIYYTLLDNDMYAYDLDNIGDFIDYVETSSDYVRTVHVYIENSEGEDPEENLAKAQEVSDILQAIEDPEDRLSRMNEFIGSKLNEDFDNVSGYGSYFTRTEMLENFEEAAFALEVWEVSEPVRIRQNGKTGYCVIMSLPREADYITTHVETLLDNYHVVALGLYIDGFAADCTVTLNEYGKSIDLLTLN